MKKFTLDDVLNAASTADARALMDTMTLGELLEMAGLTIEVEQQGADGDRNHVLTELVKQFRPKENVQ